MAKDNNTETLAELGRKYQALREKAAIRANAAREKKKAAGKIRVAYWIDAVDKKQADAAMKPFTHKPDHDSLSGNFGHQ